MICDGRPMRGPQVLYRSVSLGELQHIIDTGKIEGGGSLFNAFEVRRGVFFADKIDALLIGHGDHIPRQVTYALRDHPLSRRSDFLAGRIVRRADLILSLMVADGILIDDFDAGDFRLGFSRSKVRRLTYKGGYRNRHAYARNFGAYRRLVKALEGANAAYDCEWQRLHAEKVQERRSAPYTSAILATHPVSGGTVYEGPGVSGHGDREYCFRPGQLTLGHISQVIWVRNHKLMDRCDAGELPERLMQLRPSAESFWTP